MRRPGWRVALGDAAGLTVAAEGPRKVLRARAYEEPLVALYPPPWPANEFTAEFRLPAGDRKGVGSVFGYVDARNHGAVLLDPAAGLARVSRLVEGVETSVTQEKAAIPSRQWLDIEIQTEGATVEVQLDDDAVEFTAPLGAEVPASPAGFQVPAGSAVEFRRISLAGEARTPRLSIVSSPAYENGAATTDLLAGSTA